MLDLFKDNPWLLVVMMGMLIPIAGIVFGTTTGYLTRVRRAELEASLKEQMLQRGMSAEEIRTILEASPKHVAKRCRPDSAHSGNLPSQA